MDWENDLAELLSDLTATQSELLQVLDQKRECMGRNDFQGVADLHPRASELLAALEDCHRRRTDLLTETAKKGVSADTLGELANKSTPRKKLSTGKQVKAATAGMRQLQLQSLTNWVLAQRSLLHVSQLLEIMATGGRLQPTYGNSDSSFSGGSILDSTA